MDMDSIPEPDAYGYLIHTPRVTKWAYDNQIIDKPKKDPIDEAEGTPYRSLMVCTRSEGVHAFLRHIRKETGIPISMALVYVGGSKIMKIWKLPWSYTEEPLDDKKRFQLEKLKGLLETESDPSYWYVDDGYNQCPAFIREMDFPEEWKPFDPARLRDDQLF